MTWGCLPAAVSVSDGGAGGSAATVGGAAGCNTVSDPRNCGTCGNVCPATAPFCSNSACTAQCGAGTTVCGNSCCGAGTQCVANACVGIGVGGGGSGVGGAVGSLGGGATVGGGGPVGGGAPVGGGGVGVGGGDVGAGGGDVGAGGGAGTDPPGYTRWGEWHGCSWTGVGDFGDSTITPQDFVAKPADQAFCVSGSVGQDLDYRGVALLGFNVNEPNTTTCEYKPVDVNAAGPPSVTVTGQGVAVNFVKQGADTSFTLRVQLQGPNGHKEGDVGAADRWCANITEVQGKVFVPYSAFTTECWGAAGEQGTAFNPATNAVSAVVFLVPGKDMVDVPYEFCVNGFAYGTTAEDAPDGPAVAGDQMGTVGGKNDDDLDFDRAKVNVGGENYIIQNNNWGNPGGSDCILNYLNASFSVTECTGTGASAPAAFPSIYIGANGNILNGNSTTSTDNLPIQISQIQSIDTTFRYSGGNGSYNACYDIWFANSPPAPGSYNDGINGFAMVWLRDPSDKQAIGTQMGSATIGGQSWNIWVGPRGDGPEGFNNAPVVSYVNPTQDDNSRAQSFVNKNLLEFITHATTVSGGLNANMYLTDVFGGFEIWSGGAGLKVDEFKAVVNKK
jgi:Glycosyl hydrolase family 12